MEKIFRDGRKPEVYIEDSTELKEYNSGYGENATLREALIHYSTLSYPQILDRIRPIFDDVLRDYILDPSKEERRAEEGTSAKQVLKRLGIKSSFMSSMRDMLQRRGGIQVAYEASEDFFDFIRSHEYHFDPTVDQSLELVSSIPSTYIAAVIPYGKEEQEYYREHTLAKR